MYLCWFKIIQYAKLTLCCSKFKIFNVNSVIETVNVSEMFSVCFVKLILLKK